MAYEFKDMAAVDVAENVTDNTNVVVEQDGMIKRVPASNIGGRVIVYFDDYGWNDDTEKYEYSIYTDEKVYEIDEDGSPSDTYICLTEEALEELIDLIRNNQVCFVRKKDYGYSGTECYHNTFCIFKDYYENESLYRNTAICLGDENGGIMIANRYFQGI